MSPSLIISSSSLALTDTLSLPALWAIYDPNEDLVGIDEKGTLCRNRTQHLHRTVPIWPTGKDSTLLSRSPRERPQFFTIFFFTTVLTTVHSMSLEV